MADRLHSPRIAAWLASSVRTGDETSASGRLGEASSASTLVERSTSWRARLSRRGWWRLVVGVGVLVAMASVAAALVDGDERSFGVAGVPWQVAHGAADVDRDVDSYAGYGTWVDVYDYLPDGSGAAPVTSATVADMADQGVHTLYLQAARFDASRPELLTDPRLLAEFLVQAHQHGMRVVAWYLPRFVDVNRDLAHLEAISEFEVLGHRFDGVAVDIEFTGDVPDHAERSNRLVDLSERLRAAVGDDDALGAIVLPPVQTEVINPNMWPDFPWRDLADLYDVWLPMGYWTVRTPESGYHDGWSYTDESIRRLRANLDDPGAVVHAIGGIGDLVTPEHAQGFVRALHANNTIGGSIYDWYTLDPTVGAEIADGIPVADD